MVLFSNFINIFYISELRRKVLYTLGLLIVYRIRCAHTVDWYRYCRLARYDGTSKHPRWHF